MEGGKKLNRDHIREGREGENKMRQDETMKGKGKNNAGLNEIGRKTKRKGDERKRKKSRN